MSSDLAATLADYRAGLDLEVRLLTDLEVLACRQRDLPHPLSLDQLIGIGDQRQHLMGRLLEVEAHIRPLREAIVARLDVAQALPGFRLASDRHRLAGEIVARIRMVDAATLDALQAAERAHRHTATDLDAGEATLAAYRRVLAHAPGPGLVNQRG